MSRSGYSDDCDGWDLICWRGAVASAIRGKRGQAFLREMLAALDTIEDRALIADELEADGEVCALGAVGRARKIDMSPLDSYDRESIAAAFNIPLSLASEIMFLNDDAGPYGEKPEARFVRIRAWVEEQIKDAPSPPSARGGEREG